MIPICQFIGVSQTAFLCNLPRLVFGNLWLSFKILWILVTKASQNKICETNIKKCIVFAGVWKHQLNIATPFRVCHLGGPRMKGNQGFWGGGCWRIPSIHIYSRQIDHHSFHHAIIQSKRMVCQYTAGFLNCPGTPTKPEEKQKVDTKSKNVWKETHVPKHHFLFSMLDFQGESMPGLLKEISFSHL